MFTTLGESVSYCIRHFPADTYDCIVGLVGLMGSISELVVSQTAIKNQMLVGTKTGISPRHSAIVALFSGSYPVILSAPKVGLDSIQVIASVDFGAMRTFEEWDRSDTIHGLAITRTPYQEHAG